MSTDTSPEQPTPEIQIDSDWKTEAQAEKNRLSEAEIKAEVKTEDQKMPEPNFRGLLGILASQALMGLGMHQDPSGNGVMVDLEGSKFTIDLLDMLVAKTDGNLSEEEVTELKQLTQELQNRFVQIAQLVAAQMQDGANNPMAAGGLGETAPKAPTAGGIIDPTA
ncbi:MAG: DUF1844 domain-containing protein [Phycisphaerales bacterium]